MAAHHAAPDGGSTDDEEDEEELAEVLDEAPDAAAAQLQERGTTPVRPRAAHAA